MSALLDLTHRVLGAREKEARWLRENASVRRAIPWREHDDVPIIPMTSPPVSAIPVEVNVKHDYGTPPSVPATPSQPTTTHPAIPAWVKAAILSGGGLLVGAGGLYLVNYLNRPQPQSPPTPIVVDERPTTAPLLPTVDPDIPPTTETGSLLQYLEDEGYHLPNGEP